MKTTLTRSGWLLLMLLFLTSIKSVGEEYKKTISETYNVKPGAVLMIDNKFGDVVCNNWDKMAIEINVTITVHSSSQAKANEVFDRIRVSLNGNDSRVEGVTSIEEMKGNQKFSIDYTVNMPSDLNVDLTNKYGMLMVGDIDRSAKIDLKYGDLKTGNLSSIGNEIYVKYGNAEIEYIKEGIVDVKYADLEIDKAQSLEIDSKYNDVTIDRIESATMNTGYDDINIDQVKSLQAEAKFSVIEIDRLQDYLNIEMEYGGCQVDEVSSEFSTINIVAQYTGIELEFDEGSSYQLSVDVSYSGFDYPSNATVTKKKQSHTSALYEGYVGSDSNASAKVIIKARHGGVELR